MSPYKFFGAGGGGRPPWVHILPLPDTYRGRHLDGAAAAAGALAQAAAAGGAIGALFIESALSCGGQVLLPPGYLRDVYRAMRAAGAVIVADEVQCGFGRLGLPGGALWGFQAHPGALPDIVVAGKAIGAGPASPPCRPASLPLVLPLTPTPPPCAGNGFPMAAVVTTPALAAAFAAGGMEFFSTTGGCNAAAAAGSAVMQVRAAVPR